MTRTINFRKKKIDSNAEKNSWVGVPKTSIFNLGLRQALCMFSNYNMCTFENYCLFTQSCASYMLLCFKGILALF